jgi:hypothetical protein
MTLPHARGMVSAGAGPTLRPPLRVPTLPDFGISWLDEPAEPFAPPRQDATPTLELVRAVAGILAIAVERMREHGSLEILREAVQRVLDQAEAEPDSDPREAEMPEPPAIADAEPQGEAERLAALWRRQARG